jgi:hypothetical protein
MRKQNMHAIGKADAEAMKQAAGCKSQTYRRR